MSTITNTAHVSTLNLFAKSGYNLFVSDKYEDVTGLDAIIEYTSDETTDKKIQDFEAGCYNNNYSFNQIFNFKI